MIGGMTEVIKQGQARSPGAASPRPAHRRGAPVERHVDVPDPFVSARFDEVTAEVDRLARLGSEYFPGDPIGRKRRSAVDPENPATRQMRASIPLFAAWMASVPTAAALDPLYDPEAVALPSGEPIDEDAREWFRNIADARGIRSRAAVMCQVLEQQALEEVDRPRRWLSLACGAAQPVFRSLAAVDAHGGRLPDVTLVDLDRSALALAAGYAAARVPKASVRLTRSNVLARRGLGPRWCIPAGWPAAPWREAFDAVDAVGLLEYLKADDWRYTYRGIITSRRTMAGAVTFLRNAWDCVRPGGLLLLGNMLDTHPQLGFTLNVIQWPHIQPRSVSTMLDLFRRAGLDGTVEVIRPTDGVYAVYVVRKPA